jgi:phosphoserine aminotransferase
MYDRIYNFNPGPSMLPVEILEEAHKEFFNYKGTGMSVMEISHRSKPFEEIILSAEALLKELMQIPDNYRVLFIGMGATGQFDMVPMNYIVDGKVGNYAVTGSFANKAYKEAVKIGPTHVAGNTKEINFVRVCKDDEIKLSDNPAYLHITTNNTIFGTQWKTEPSIGEVPLVADMSSDILSKKIDVSKYALIYAGAQKNLGPAGAAVVIIRDDMIEKSNPNLPVMLKYDTYAKNNSLYNTPASFTIYMIRLMLEWAKKQGGLSVIEKRNEEKAGLIYNTIDKSNGFFKGHAEAGSRSLMNITFRLPNEDLDKEFIAEAAKIGLGGLKGHREVGGMRASVYNSMPTEGCKKLADLMVEFQKKNG